MMEYQEELETFNKMLHTHTCHGVDYGNTDFDTLGRPFIILLANEFQN
jgi:hypothetical protein